jgi:hypothetical protein
MVFGWIAKSVSKQAFLDQLKPAWKQNLHGDFDIESELEKAKKRIKKSHQEKLFKTIGITDEDIRKVLQEIKDEKKV